MSHRLGAPRGRDRCRVLGRVVWPAASHYVDYATLPHGRRVLVLGPRGVDRTLELGFVLRNALGGLDRQRAAEQAA